MAWYKRKITVSDDTVTSAANLTLRQSLIPNALGRRLCNETLRARTH